MLCKSLARATPHIACALHRQNPFSSLPCSGNDALLGQTHDALLKQLKGSHMCARMFFSRQRTAVTLRTNSATAIAPGRVEHTPQPYTSQLQASGQTPRGTALLCPGGIAHQVHRNPRTSTDGRSPCLLATCGRNSINGRLLQRRWG